MSRYTGADGSSITTNDRAALAEFRLAHPTAPELEAAATAAEEAEKAEAAATKKAKAAAARKAKKAAGN